MKNTEKETRLINIEDFTIERRDDGTDGLIIEGYAAVFNARANIGGWFEETIDKGAFDGADMRDVPMKYNHSDVVPILARTRNNSLTLSVDDHGLHVRAELLDTTDGVDMYKRIKAGLIDKMSFAFTVLEDSWTYGENGTDYRIIKKFDRIFDVSVVDVPAYDETSIIARSKEIAEAASKSLLENREKQRAATKPKLSEAATKIILLQGGKIHEG
ncbi:MAG: HK97 family phage prohead protease [Clostridia bacterium]|nr:HK97 family phage prohead protease [Clostridia bacterium]